MDSEDWDRRYRAERTVWSLSPNRWVEQHTAELPAGRALDLASGEGRNAIWLAERGWQVLGVDFSPVALAKAADRVAGRADLAQRLNWDRADLVDYVPPRRTFDLVLVSYLHLPAVDRRTVLTRAVDALAVGGRLVIVGHDSTNPTEGVGGPQDQAVLFSPQDVLDDVTDRVASGELAVRYAQRVRRPVESAGADAIDALVVLDRTR